jgi:2-dehydropantoate 2-reductase
MRIVAFGSGGVGGYFGARLAAAGEDVAFIARGRHLEAMRREGLRVVSPKGDLHLPRVDATDDPASLGPADVVMFTVKMYDAEAAAAQLRPLIGPDTAVITFQNGVEAVDIVARHVGAAHVVGGVAYVAAVITEPGVIKHTALDRLIFGEADGTPSPRLLAFAAAGERAGYAAVASAHIQKDLWGKFARLATFSGTTSLTRLPIGPIRADAALLDMVQTAIREVMTVGRARGVQLDDSVLTEAVQMMRTMPDGSKSSMLEDLERGRTLELPWLSGAVVRLGREAGVATPIHQFIATALGPWVNGNPLG